MIATPGRLLDLFERGKILLNDVKYFVIDEADRMLDMGFIPDVERIAKLVPQIRQTLFFSATMDKEIRRLSEAFLMNPKEVAVDPPATTAETVAQALVTTTEDNKREALRRLIRAEGIENGFIFCNRKKDVDILFKSLTKHGFNAVALHGDMVQAKRTEMLAAFKTGEAGLLVCSDVAARGLDISAVPFVINFDVPHNPEDYVHRIGRTGRAGMQGKAFTIAVPADGKMLAAIEALIGGPIPRADIESLKDLNAAVTAEGRTRNKRSKSKKKASAKETKAKKTDNAKAKPKKDSSSRKKKRGRHDPDVGEMNHDDDVVAFGSHTPSFLKSEPRENTTGERKAG